MENTEIVFVEHDEQELTDKPHCGDCNFQPEVTTTDKPHCSDCHG